MSESLCELIESRDGFTIKWRGRFLASPYSPRKRAETYSRAAELETNTLYLIVHPLFGYGTDILLERLPENSFLLMVENEKEIDQTTHAVTNQCPPDSEKSRYICSSSLFDIIKAVETTGLWRFRRCRELIPHGPVKDSFCTELQEQLAIHLNLYWKNRITTIELGKRWIGNILNNIPLLEKGESFPQSDKALLLCGAGSSLDSIWNELEPLRDRFFVLAVDTALPAFRERGIQPDAVVNVDAQFYNSLDFYHSGDSLCIFSDLSCFPSTLRKHRHSFFFSRFCRSPFMDDLANALRIPVIPPLGSVAITALDLASKITRGPIITAGLDFAYTRGASHVKGSIFHQHYLLKHQRLSPDAGLTGSHMKGKSLPVEGENLLYTDPLLQSYHRDFQRYINRISNPVYQWNQRGLPLEIPCFAHEILTQPQKGSICNNSGTPMNPDPMSGKTDYDGVMQLQNKWKEQCRKLLKKWDLYQQKDELKPALMKQLKEMDYLFFDSPYNPPLTDETVEKLLPFIKRARKILAIIERNQSPSSVRSTERNAD